MHISTTNQHGMLLNQSESRRRLPRPGNGAVPFIFCFDRNQSIKKDNGKRRVGLKKTTHTAKVPVLRVFDKSGHMVLSS